MKNTLYILLLLLCPVLFVQCQKDETASAGQEVDVTFTARISDVQFSTKAMGDGSKVDKLSVGLFDKQGNLVWRNEDDIQISVSSPATVKVPMFKGREYDVVFWAQSSECTSYNTDNLKAISITYGSGSINDYATIEQLDAFHCLKTGVSHNTADKTITLTRPFTQLNMGVPVSVLEELESSGYSIGSVKLTVGGVADEFNALTGVKSGDKTFTFTFNTLPDGSVKVKNDKGEEIEYKYLATTYLFASEDKVSATLQVFNGNETEPFSTVSYEDTPAEPNERTNLFGNTVKVPVRDEWDGNPDEQGIEINGLVCYIKTAGGLAWLAANNNDPKVTSCTTFILQANMNMAGKTVSAIKLPAGSTFDGNDKTIKNIKPIGNSLFTDGENLIVKNLSIDGIQVETINGHVGTLVNMLRGGGSFKKVDIKNSSLKTGNGAAGGFVGYIVRKNATDRSESYTVSFDDCSIESVSLDATISEGVYVGLMSGYDNKEILNFNASNKVGTEMEFDYVSQYIEGNEGAWLAEKDYSKYNGWLGDEEYYRGIVNFGEDRFVPRWDGSKYVEPLLANATYDSGTTAGANRFVVYSPFDLVGIRNKTASPAAIYLRADIDMNGQGSDGKFNVPSNFTKSAYSSTDDNTFAPFNYCTTLDGKKNDDENFSIYNMSISQIEQERAAFILYASGTTIHKNLNFKNCQTVAVHKVVPTDAKAYGAILVSNVDATYTMENVHAYNCKVFALQKVGTLGARISGTSTLKNNSVNNCYVENYECTIKERFESGAKEILGVKIKNVYADFYPHGEVGGMYGFIQGNSNLTSCQVNRTTVHAFGQDDQEATIQGDGFWGYLAAGVLKGAGYYLVPGRHVSKLIGNIRATGTVILMDCKVDSETKCTNRHDMHSSTCNYIGQAYIVKFLDNEGSVYVDDKELTLADCNKNTTRSASLNMDSLSVVVPEINMN